MNEISNAKKKINVELVYALPDQQVLHSFEVEEDTTVNQLIELSCILEQHPEIDLVKKNKIGIFGKLTKPTVILRDKDRVEIYRPLIADPKEVRRRRAAEGKAMKKGGGDLKGDAKTDIDSASKNDTKSES
ncbi:MAG: RnfH family protein [Gammaproteobacteria bacterium]|nr:RnfH family protein [Gammaproteobacteria bacterium]